MLVSSRSLSFLNVTVHALTIDDIIAAIDDSISHNTRCLIANHNLHSIYLYNKCDGMMKSFYNMATYTHIDGMSLILIGRLLGYNLTIRNRITFIDLIPVVLFHAVQKRWRVYYLGTTQDTVKKGVEILEKNFPGLNIRFHNGYFDTSHDCQDNINIINTINAYHPHILLVGMGMPRQELWIVDNCERLSVNTIFNSGAYMDYIAGNKLMPPRWLGPLGLEWLYRLISEPRRLRYRYLGEPWFLLRYLAKDIMVRLTGTK